MLRFTMLVSLLLGSFCSAESGKVGLTVENFTLQDNAGKKHALTDYKDRKAVVVVFLGTECPVNNAFLPVLSQLHRTYSDKGVQLLAINANRQDTPERIAAHVKKHEIPFPVLKDSGNVVADQLKAERTPEALIISQGKIVYRGRIDDRFGVKHRRDKASRQDLVVALDEVLAGKPVSVAVTEVEGCFIARVAVTKAEGAVTFTKHVSSILQKNCQECHRPGQIGPMPLLSYRDAVDWSATIKEVVEEKRMPPWHADPKHGKFANDRTLTKQDRDNLIAWIDNGMPKGDDRDAPPPAQFAEGWRIGKPDVVFEIPSEFTVPPKSERNSIRYQYFVVPTNFKEDRWVQAAEARPSNRKVVHHIIVYVQGPGQVRDRRDGIGAGFLVPYAPGDMPLVLGEGSAKKIPKGSLLIFQMHYTPVATQEKDRSSVGLIFSKKPPENEARTRSIAQRRLDIPAGAENHKVASSTTMAKDSLLLSLLPHMHLRGKSFEYRATYPDGKTEVLLKVPEYDFNWQTVYRLEKPIRLPAGTRIDCSAVFDNSNKNRNNPDSTKAVRWGEQTWEEMMIGFIDYVSLPDPKEEDNAQRLKQAREQLEQNEPRKALEVLARVLEQDPKNVEGWMLRGQVNAKLDQHAEAVKAFTRVLELDPKAAEAIDQRGIANFKAGRIVESATDFDAYIKAMPDKFNGHWRRGITLYYAGKFDEGRKQFEGYEKVDTNDVENAVWHFLCVARKDGVEKARASILKIGKDRRVPMMTVYELFQGKAKPEDVMKAVEEGNPGKAEKDFRLFYAHLYLGLYGEVTGDSKLALKHLSEAAEKPRVHPYMWDVARVHRDLLKAKTDR